MPSRSLLVDARRASGRDRAQSREEALQQLITNEYDTIELYTTTPGQDDYGLVAYLSATWPNFFRHVTVRTITPGRRCAEWSHEAGKFILEVPRRRYERQPHTRHVAPAMEAERLG